MAGNKREFKRDSGNIIYNDYDVFFCTVKPCFEKSKKSSKKLFKFYWEKKIRIWNSSNIYIISSFDVIN